MLPSSLFCQVAFVSKFTDGPNIFFGCPATTANHIGPSVSPLRQKLLKDKFIAHRAFEPGASWRVVLLSGIRVDNQRFTGHSPHLVQERLSVFGSNAVGPKGHNLLLSVQETCTLLNAGATRILVTVCAGEAEVGKLIGKLFLKQATQCLNFVKSGHCFEGNKVWFFFCDGLQQPSVVVLILLC